MSEILNNLQDPPQIPTDWVAGQETGIVWEDRSVKWGDYLPTSENQYMPKRQKSLVSLYDTSGCTNWSGLNTLEVQANWMLKTGILSLETIDKCKELGLIEDGQFNFSDRFSYLISGTTENGNSISEVAKAHRKFGLIADMLLPFDDELDTLQEFQEIPTDYESLRETAKKFLEIFDIQHEWVIPHGHSYTSTEIIDILKHHLKQAPIQIGAYVCPKWSRWTATEDTVIDGCPSNKSGHATIIYDIDEYIRDFDHYYPFKKKLALDYPIKHALKVLLIEKKSKPLPVKPFFVLSKNLELGERNTDVKHLQEFLIYKGYLKQGLNTGYYGENTRLAVQALQWGCKITNFIEHTLIVKGRYVGPRTRAFINNAVLHGQ